MALNIFKDIHKRKVFRVATVYSVAAWLLMQVLDIVLPTFNAPQWVNQTLLLLLLLGLPLVTIIAWVMEDKNTHVGTEQKVSLNANTAIFAESTIMSIAFGVVFISVVFLLGDRFVFSSDSRPQNSNSSNSNLSLGVQRSSINLGADQTFALAELMPLGVGRKSVAISNQGNFLAYVANQNGELKIYIRPLDSFEAYPLDGTEGGFSPFFSPDEQWLGFLPPTHIMKIPVAGGRPQTLTEAGNVYGLYWGQDNNIIFSEREGIQVSSVSADGGTKEVLLEATDFLSNPEVLPNEKGILLTNMASVIQLFDPISGSVTPLIPRGRDARYVDTGHIVYAGMESYMAVSFDLESLSIEGSPFPILDGVLTDAAGVTQLTFSRNGILAYVPGVDMGITNPTWVDRDGNERAIPINSGRYGSFDLSPDDSQLAFSIVDAEDSDVWVYDFERTISPQRLTVNRGALFPKWSPDGDSISYGAQNIGNTDVRARLDIQGLGELDSSRITGDFADLVGIDTWGDDGEAVITAMAESNQGLDLYIIDTTTLERRGFAATESQEWGATFSPNKDFIAFTTDTSGQYQINVKRFPPTEERWIISSGYGEEPVWSEDGNEIFYRRGNEWLAVPVESNPDFVAGVPEVLFEGPYGNVPGLSYQVTQDGNNFLLLKQPEQQPPTEIFLVTNWITELETGL